MLSRDQIEKILNQYFQAIDAKDLETVFSLFSDNIEYIRGSVVLRGRSEFQKFYMGERIIESGQHTIHKYIIDPPHAVILGEFNGTLKTGEDVMIDFADFHRFEDDKIGWRKTYFLNREV